MKVSLFFSSFFQGRFSLAARYHSNVAEIYEGELQDYAGAIANYERAADYYKGEDSTGSVSQGRRGGERNYSRFQASPFSYGGRAPIL
jgi:hypothetical protein